MSLNRIKTEDAYVNSDFIAHRPTERATIEVQTSNDYR